MSLTSEFHLWFSFPLALQSYLLSQRHWKGWRKSTQNITAPATVSQHDRVRMANLWSCMYSGSGEKGQTCWKQVRLCLYGGGGDAKDERDVKQLPVASTWVAALGGETGGSSPVQCDFVWKNLGNSGKCVWRRVKELHRALEIKTELKNFAWKVHFAPFVCVFYSSLISIGGDLRSSHRVRKMS